MAMHIPVLAAFRTRRGAFKVRKMLLVLHLCCVLCVLKSCFHVHFPLFTALRTAAVFPFHFER